MPYDYTFDARQFQPNQGGYVHPPGKFPAYISNTEIKPTSDGSGGFFAVEWTTQNGSIIQRFNLWNNSQKAVEIAHGQLSALCHATGIYNVDMRNDGAALRNARAVIEVQPQANSQYTQVTRVFDVNGNEPGKQPAPAAPQPMTVQPFGQSAPAAASAPGASLGAPFPQAQAPAASPFPAAPAGFPQTAHAPAAAPAAAPAPNGGWPAVPGAAPQAAPAAAPAPATAPWQQGGPLPATPPWQQPR